MQTHQRRNLINKSPEIFWGFSFRYCIHNTYAYVTKNFLKYIICDIMKLSDEEKNEFICT
jgi:hypothetical protein